MSVLGDLIDFFSKLPNLGPRSARRIVLHLLKNKEKLIDYLEREKRVIVPKEEVEDWITEVTQLFQDVERVEAKLLKL